MKCVTAYQRVVLGLCVVLTFGSIALGLLTASKAGPIWDDPVEIAMMGKLINVSLRPELDYEAGKSVVDSIVAGGSYYGIVPQFLAHALSAYERGVPWVNEEPYTFETITWRHLISLWLVLVAAAMVLATARAVTGSWLLAWSMLATLLSTPVLLGLSSIDDKDAPIAAGMTMISCGLAVILRALRFAKHEPAAVARRSGFMVSATLASMMIFIGSFVTFGTRTGAAVLIGFECFIIGLVVIALSRKDLPRLFAATAVVTGSSVLGIAIGIACNPLGRKAPIQWLLEGTLYTRNPGTMSLRLFGETVNSGNLPWWYVPGWIVAEYPIAFLGLCAIGLSGIAMLLRRPPTLHSVAPWLPFAVQGLLLPLVIVASGAVMYDRLRHLLFIVPPLCMLAGYGVYVCVDVASRSSHWRAVSVGAAAPALLLWVFTCTWIWYPYQYAYLNEVGRSFPQFSFDTEVNGLSINEAVRKMKDLGVKRFRAGPAPIFQVYDEKKDGIAVGYVSMGQNVEHRAPMRGGGYYYVHSRPSWAAVGLPDFCREVFKIERQGVVLGVGGEC